MGGTLISDEFLYRAAPTVHMEFADALYERLSRSQPSKLRVLGWIGLNQRTLKYSLALAALTAIAVACAREVLKPRYVQVGEMWVLEVAPKKVERWEFPGVSIAAGEPALSLPPDPVPLDKALKMLPYRLELPGWLPEGYSLVEQEVRPPLHPDWFLTLTWTNERGDRVAFWAFEEHAGEIRAPAGSWAERTVQGTPAIIVRGRFPGMPDMSQIYEPVELPLPTPGGSATTIELEFRWDENGGIGLIWLQAGGRFQLQTYGDYLREADLIRIAESMGPP